MHLGGLLGDGAPLARFRFVDLIHQVPAGSGAVGGNDGDLKLVGLLEFHLLGFGCAGHASQTGIQQEEVLVGDRSQGLGLWLDRHAFFGLHRLVQAIAPTATRHHPTGEFIDDHHLVVAGDVVDVFDEQLLGLQSVGDVVGPGIGCIEEILHTKDRFRLGITLVGEDHAALFFINFVIAFWVDAVFAHLSSTIQLQRQRCGLVVFLLGAFHLTGNDQRRPGFIHQDGIDFVDDAVLKLALHHLTDVGGHVVAEVIKPQLTVGGVGDITAIVLAALRRTHVLLDQAHA